MSSINVYKTYSFRTKDPVIDQLQTLAQKQCKSASSKELKKLLASKARDAGMSEGTPINWIFGKTRRPQSASIEAFGRALGKKRVWVDL